jgi:transcriptional regulator GlxA family with amidase domain
MSRLCTAVPVILFSLGVSALSSAGEAASAPAKPVTRNVAIVLYEGVEVLDFAGPAEVFAAAANFGAVGDQPAFRVYTVATSRAPLTSQGFLKVIPDFTTKDAPRPDLIVVPGGNSATLTNDAAFMAWATKAFAGAEVSMSVCTGAFVLGKAGLLDGKTATTWFGATEHLRKAVPGTSVQEGRRFIDQGRVVTTAGVSAGIDGALHVVARLLGRDVADQTARYMEYRWTPEPYLVETYVARVTPATPPSSAR